MNLKKLLCLLLALAMVFTLAACADSGSDKDEDEDDEEIVDDEDKNEDGEDEDKQDEDEDEQKDDEDKDEDEDPSDAVVGSWKGYIYMTADATGLEGFETDAGLPIVFTFEADGTVSMSAYEPELADAIDALEEDLLDYMMTVMVEMIEENGLTYEDADAMYQEEYGMSIEEYCVATVEEMDMYNSFMEVEDSTTYTIEDGQLNLDGELLTFEIDGDTMTVYDSTNPEYWEQLGMEFPVELERID